MAPLLAAASQDLTALLRAHPLAKSVHAFAAAIVRLIRPLHNVPSGEKVLPHTLGGRQPLIISTPTRERKQTVRRLPRPLVLLLDRRVSAPDGAPRGGKPRRALAGRRRHSPRIPSTGRLGQTAMGAMPTRRCSTPQSSRMRRVAPDPAVVVLTGDFLAHRFPALARPLRARSAPGTPGPGGHAAHRGRASDAPFRTRGSS